LNNKLKKFSLFFKMATPAPARQVFYAGSLVGGDQFTPLAARKARGATNFLRLKAPIVIGQGEANSVGIEDGQYYFFRDEERVILTSSSPGYRGNRVPLERLTDGESEVCDTVNGAADLTNQ
jgi:hypothetical protein